MVCPSLSLSSLSIPTECLPHTRPMGRARLSPFTDEQTEAHTEELNHLPRVAQRSGQSQVTFLSATFSAHSFLLGGGSGAVELMLLSPRLSGSGFLWGSLQFDKIDPPIGAGSRGSPARGATQQKGWWEGLLVAS